MPPRNATVDRAVFALVAASCAGVLAAARLVTPAPAGHGTHEQLGLPPCSFQLVTGHGCPSCGMTTSFSYMARGETALAFGANPFGPVLFAVAALLVPLSLALVARPPSAEAVAGSRAFAAVATGLFALMVLVWAVRLALGLV